MTPCFTHSIIRDGSSVKWSNPGKEEAPSSIPWCSSYRKRSLRVTLDYGRQLYFSIILLISFSHQHQLMVFPGSVNDSIVSSGLRTFLSYLHGLNNILIWMVSIYSLISNTSILLFEGLGLFQLQTSWFIFC